MFSDPAVSNGGFVRENIFSGNRKRNIELLVTGCAINHLTADCRTPDRKDCEQIGLRVKTPWTNPCCEFLSCFRLF